MKKLVMVDCISQHRIRYCVEVEDDIQHANDEVIMGKDIEEFSQTHLGEVIVSTREITKEEYLRMFDEDNPYLKGWEEDAKLKYINGINYDA